MKNTVVAILMITSVGVASAQGYMGAIVALSSLGVDCADKLSCDKKGHGVKLYAGSKLSSSNQIDLGGIGKVAAIEVSVMNFGKASTVESKAYYYVMDGGGVSTDPQLRTFSRVGTANALTVAAVADFPVVTDLTFSLKLGAAYVSSTIRNYIDGVQNGSVTETKLKPYIGLGVAYAIVDSVKIVGSYDRTAFDVDGHKSHANIIGVGAEVGF